MGEEIVSFVNKSDEFFALDAKCRKFFRHFIKNNQSIYEELGFDEERSKLVNFYHKKLTKGQYK